MLFLATDHRGLKLKNQLKNWLVGKKIPFKDLGAFELNALDDYPDFAKLLSNKVSEQPDNRGVIFCGSGIGVTIACNKCKGIRCGLGFNHTQVSKGVEDDDMNVLAIASDFTSKFKCFQLVKAFVSASFKPEERFIRRREKVTRLEIE